MFIFGRRSKAFNARASATLGACRQSKNRMLLFLIPAVFLAAFVPQSASAAEPSICVSSFQGSGSQFSATIHMFGGEEVAGVVPDDLFVPQFFAPPVRCEDLAKYKFASDVMKITVSTAALGAAVCAVAAPPTGPVVAVVELGLAGAGIVLGVVDLALSNVPCDDGSEEKIKEIVCKAMNKNGANCDPANLP